MHSEQNWINGTIVGSELPITPGPVLAVASNNASGNKLDAFVGTRVEYQAGECPTEPVQSSRLTVTLRNDAPTDLPSYCYGRVDDPSAPEGSTNLLVHLYAPVGAVFGSATIDGKAAHLFAVRMLAWSGPGALACSGPTF